jgi:SAM-dependent methyltransferase
MLARSEAHGAVDGGAPISFQEVAAEALAVEAASFDVVTCQQGLQFFPDKPAALARVLAALRPGGRAAFAVWDADEPLMPFDVYIGALQAAGVPEPFPGAFNPAWFRLGAGTLRDLFIAAGFDEVSVSREQRDAVFGSVDDVVDAIYGTPFSPLVESLDPAVRDDVLAQVRAHFGGKGALHCPQVSLFALAARPLSD